MKTHQEITDRLRKTLENSAFKPRSKSARIAESSMLMGMMFADESYQNAYLQVLLISGKSILEGYPPR